jgi:hypothetical protein
MLESLTAATFQAQLGTSCRLHTGPSLPPRALLISEVAEAPSRATGYRIPFTVLFLGGTEPPLPQGTYLIEHPVLGRIELFVVPIGPNGSGHQRYEAVFG